MVKYGRRLKPPSEQFFFEFYLAKIEVFVYATSCPEQSYFFGEGSLAWWPLHLASSHHMNVQVIHRLCSLHTIVDHHAITIL